MSELAFEISLTRNIRADREFVFDWWTDLVPEDSKLVKPLKKREIISKSSDLVMLRDEEQMYFKRMRFDVRVSLDRPGKWISEYDGPSARAISVYVLKSESDASTTLSYKSVIEPRGTLTKLFSPFVRILVQHIFEGEMKIFIQTLESDYRRKQSARSKET